MAAGGRRQEDRDGRDGEERVATATAHDEWVGRGTDLNDLPKITLTYMYQIPVTGVYRGLVLSTGTTHGRGTKYSQYMYTS